MTGAAVVAGGLLVLAGLDGAFAGFRASCGRTGLIRHRAADRAAARRGVRLLAVLLAPALVVAGADVLARSGRLPLYEQAGAAMLAVYAPYGALVLLALAGYLTLSWRRRFLASAVLLGPLTLLRPAVAVTGLVLAVLSARDLLVGLVAFAATFAVLLVEPLAGRRESRLVVP